MSAAALLTSLSNAISFCGSSIPLSTTSAAPSSSSTENQDLAPPPATPEQLGTNLDATLAMLQVLHARVFPAALGVVIHAHESIFCLRVADAEIDGVQGAADDVRAMKSSLPSFGRCIYQVGKHLVFAPPTVYCCCHSFRFQAMQRQEVLFCKHILALRLALLLDERFREGETGTSLNSATSAQLLLPQHRIVRERLISAEEFAALMMEL